MIAMSLGYAIKEILVRWTNAPGSKVRPLHDTIVCKLFTPYRKPPMPSAVARHKPIDSDRLIWCLNASLIVNGAAPSK